MVPTLLRAINNPPARRFPAAGTVVCLVLLVLPAVAPRARGQVEDDPAATVLALVHGRYGALRSLRARFEQRYVHRLHQREERWRGRIAVRRPDRLRIDYEEPRGRVVASDGTSLVSYDPEPAPGVWFEQPVSEGSLPLAFGLLTGEPLELDVRRLDASATGFVGDVIEVRPQRPVPTIERVLLYVDRSEARRGRVHRLMIVDPAGNTNRFDLLDQEDDPALPASLFAFRPPAAARRVEP